MIREGRQAEVTYCKTAKTLRPVLATARIPKESRILNGDENTRMVKKATCIIPDYQRETKADFVTAKFSKSVEVQAEHGVKLQPVSERFPETVSFEEQAVIKQVEHVQVQEGRGKIPVQKRIMPKEIDCKKVEKDVTLETLFKGWKKSGSGKR